MLGPDGEVLDSARYDNIFHSQYVITTAGVALERLAASLDGFQSQAWRSAASTHGFGSPGMPNTQHLALDSSFQAFEIINKVFSPNGDGHQDFTAIRFPTIEPGSSVTVGVYDEHGRFIHQLIDHEIPATSDIFSWSGESTDEHHLPSGIYILAITVIDPQHTVYQAKATTVLVNGR